MKRGRSQDGEEHGVVGTDDGLGAVVLPAPVGALDHHAVGGGGAGVGVGVGVGVGEGDGGGDAGAAGADFSPAVGVEVFNEAETRALIRLRHEMNPQFQMHLRKRGIRDCYNTLTQRLHEEGAGQFPPRTATQVAQKWNNLIGSFRDHVMQRPGSSRPRSFRYEEDMAWCRDLIDLEAGKRPRLSTSGEEGAEGKGKTEDGTADWQAFWQYLDSLLKSGTLDDATTAVVTSACGNLMIAAKRQPLVDLWRLNNNWAPESLLLHLKATLDAFEA